MFLYIATPASCAVQVQHDLKVRAMYVQLGRVHVKVVHQSNLCLAFLRSSVCKTGIRPYVVARMSHLVNFRGWASQVNKTGFNQSTQSLHLHEMLHPVLAILRQFLITL